MMPIQMRIWSEAITASEFCLLFDSHKMAIFNIRLLHIRLCLRPTSAIPCIKFSDLPLFLRYTYLPIAIGQIYCDGNAILIIIIDYDLIFNGCVLLYCVDFLTRFAG